jgi:hypothetical protein
LLGVRTVLRPDAVAPVNFFNRSLIRYAFGKRERSLGIIRFGFGMKKSQQWSTNQSAGSNSTRKKCHQNPQIKESRLSSVFLVHQLKRAMNKHAGFFHFEEFPVSKRSFYSKYVEDVENFVADAHSGEGNAMLCVRVKS